MTDAAKNLDEMLRYKYTPLWQVEPHKLSHQQFNTVFDNRYVWPRHENVNDEDQFYVNFIYDNYVLERTRSELFIRAKSTPSALRNVAITAPKSEAEELDWNPHKVDYYNQETGIFDADAINASSTLKSMPYISRVMTTRTGVDEITGQRTIENGMHMMYGMFQVCAMLPAADGAWPALWLLPTFAKWPSNWPRLPEIDFMESFNSEEAKRGIYHVAVHSYDTPDGKMDNLLKGETFIDTGIDLTESYNYYGVDLQEDYITFLFNGDPMLKLPTPSDMKGWPWHLLMNLAVGGGEWKQQPNADHYPDNFGIKSVQFYQRGGLRKEVPQAADVIATLPDGRDVKRSDVNLVTEMLIAIGEGDLKVVSTREDS